uniref:THAP domain-containing protein 1 n=1 Tax=Salarias fasciatus TaxID=181472 RepID=A0A672GX83_SALFA
MTRRFNFLNFLVGNKGSAVNIYSFPKDGKSRKKWEDACGRVQLRRYPYLCSRHFSADSFEDFRRHQKLKKDTVATISVHKRISAHECRAKAGLKHEKEERCWMPVCAVSLLLLLR